MSIFFPNTGIVDPACPLDWSHPLNRGLVSRWKVIPNSGWRGGLTFRGLSRGGKVPNDATLTNGPSWSGSSYRGGYGSIDFSGTNDYLTFASGNPGFANATTITVSLWLYATSTSGVDYAGLFSSAGSASSWYFWLPLSSGQVEWNAVGTGADATFNSGITLGWQHFCFTYDGAAAKIYKNGVEAASASGSGSLASSTTMESKLLSFYPQGKWDDICIWANRGLSAREVSQLYQEQLRGSPETLRWVGSKTYGITIAESFKVSWARNYNNYIGAGRA